LAQTNSDAKTASPSGITTKAGPGKTIMAIPIRRTVPPISAIKKRLAFWVFLI